MIRSSRTSRYLLLFLTIIVCLGALPTPVHAADPAAPPGAVSGAPVAPAALFGAFTGSVLGNRQRMVQYAFVAFGIGVLILVTATRKH
ncbi:MAG TPA: hypothetical protein VNX28_17340 [Gemmataceae bacterium]|jgi:hypothetical protein|nr:hypothetical protein [Gemmataceae bacterium]